MKNLKFFVALLVAMTVASCGNKAEKETHQKSNTVVEKVKPGNNLVKGARELAAESEALKKLDPIAIEDLKKWFPESIGGLSKTNSDAIAMAGAVTAFVTYGTHTNKQINLQMIDGAGDKGAAATGVFRAIKYDKTNNESYGDYNKIKEYEGTVVREDFDKNQNRYILGFFYNDRFAIKLKVTGFEQHEIWNIFKEFKLDGLTN
ncbi:hypothetical protein PP180_04695 [Muricauda sp. SK9]|uniref:hypothetical protein n=1 Tax=Flavobacteriaceae TaxID=49546 RepID=UPI0011C46DAE|nr:MULTISPECIES: hypothetical protein [Allomuricauda]MDC6384648.1 hypothetical protein [Muricauda sp. SK9]